MRTNFDLTPTTQIVNQSPIVLNLATSIYRYRYQSDADDTVEL
jgi:hypothetical protein